MNCQIVFVSQTVPKVWSAWVDSVVCLAAKRALYKSCGPRGSCPWLRAVVTLPTEWLKDFFNIWVIITVIAAQKWTIFNENRSRY
jgi:hypothetical protein